MPDCRNRAAKMSRKPLPNTLDKVHLARIDRCAQERGRRMLSVLPTHVEIRAAHLVDHSGVERHDAIELVRPSRPRLQHAHTPPSHVRGLPGAVRAASRPSPQAQKGPRNLLRLRGPWVSAEYAERPARARRPILPQPCAAVLSAMAVLTSGFGMGPGDPRLQGRARAGRLGSARLLCRRARSLAPPWRLHSVRS